MRALRTLAVTAAALLWARAATSQPKPTSDDADVEIPAGPPSAPPPTSPNPSSQSPSPAPSPAPPPSPSVAPAQSPKAAASVSGSSAPAAPPIATAAPEVEALRRELAETKARVQSLETRPAPEPEKGLGALAPRDYAISAYVQAQYERHQDSEDQLQQGGVYLNQNRFLIRRGRVRLDAAWQFAELAIEIDGNTTRGATFGLRRAEASLVYRGSGGWSGKVERRGARDADPPPIMLTFGLTEIPFGFELVDSSRDRVFMERSLGSLSFFPGEPDVGVRVAGGLGVLRYSIALMNGEPLDDRPGGRAARDPNGDKDIIARVGADVSPSKALRVAGGVSVLRGQGFHAGTDSTKNTLQWVDSNENAQVDPGEVTAAPGAGATPSANFARWGYGVDLRARLRTSLGETMAYGEVTLGKNLDRGLFVADPVVTSIDTRELAYYAALVQDVTPYGIVGVRYDLYDPNADFFDKRSGKLAPTSQAIRTISPLVGLVLPGRARLVFQYDFVHDLLARDVRGVPVDLRNDRWMLRLQVHL